LPYGWSPVRLGRRDQRRRRVAAAVPGEEK
jgi:hypothetical protein